jgi:hypothetical protein
LKGWRKRHFYCPLEAEKRPSRAVKRRRRRLRECERVKSEASERVLIALRWI